MAPTRTPQHGSSVLRTFAMSMQFESIPTRLAAHPDETRTLGNLNETCLHWSCFHRGPAYAILPMAEAYPEACGIVGACGRNPLHIVCAGGGRGTVNALEETVDLVENLVGYNLIMSCLASVEDGETPISALWGVYTRQFRRFLQQALARLGEEKDEEYSSMLRQALEQRKAARAFKTEVEATKKRMALLKAPPPPRPWPQLPAWAIGLPTAAERNKEASTQSKSQKHKRTLFPSPLNVNSSYKQARRHSPIPPSDCACLGGYTGPNCDNSVELPLTNESPQEDIMNETAPLKEEMNETDRILLVQVEKMLILIHAADYVLSLYPGAFPKPLATESPIGGHFIFHPLPHTVPERDGVEYGSYWDDKGWNPLRGAIRVYQRLGELGCPESFMLLLIGLFPECCHTTTADKMESPLCMAANAKNIPRSVINRLLDTSTHSVLCASGNLHTPLHIAVSSGRCWEDGVKSILDANPSALSVQDTRTRLYPFMLAATNEWIYHEMGQASKLELGEGKHMIPVSSPKLHPKVREAKELNNLNTVFNLLLECPVLVEVHKNTTVVLTKK